MRVPRRYVRRLSGGPLPREVQSKFRDYGLGNNVAFYSFFHRAVGTILDDAICQDWADTIDCQQFFPASVIEQLDRPPRCIAAACVAVACIAVACVTLPMTLRTWPS